MVVTDPATGQSISVDSYYAGMVTAIKEAEEALRREPDHLEARLQLGRAAWDLGKHLQTRRLVPGDDLDRYRRLVVEALTPLAAQGSHPELCQPALSSARRR
jgi:hypothetical protein